MEGIDTAYKKWLKKLLPEPVTEYIRELKYSDENVRRYQAYCDAVTGKDGVEIGGPTWKFRYGLPLYKAVRNLDGVNFSHTTVWEGTVVDDGEYNYYRNKSGKQFVREATDLSGIAENHYDFLISSNCLEHIANPIKALLEWKRVVKPGGFLIVLVPDKRLTFDWRRDTTSLDHLVADFLGNKGEDDLTHVEDVLEKHDLSKDPWAGGFDSFKSHLLDNYHHRWLHHHVFDTKLLCDVCEYAKLKVIRSDEITPDVAILAEKSR